MKLSITNSCHCSRGSWCGASSSLSSSLRSSVRPHRSEQRSKTIKCNASEETKYRFWCVFSRHFEVTDTAAAVQFPPFTLAIRVRRSFNVHPKTMCMWRAHVRIFHVQHMNQLCGWRMYYLILWVFFLFRHRRRREHTISCIVTRKHNLNQFLCRMHWISILRLNEFRISLVSFRCIISRTFWGYDRHVYAHQTLSR